MRSHDGRYGRYVGHVFEYEYEYVFEYVFAVWHDTHCPTYGNAHVRKFVTVVWMCAGTLATEAKTSGKYHHFQVKFYVFKGPATIVRSHI